MTEIVRREADFEPQNYMPSREEFRLVVSIGEVMADSGFFDGAKGQAQAIAKILAGRELGIGPFAAMNGIHLIKGKPCVGANLIASAIKRHPTYGYRVREKTDTVCAIEFFDGAESLGVETWTIAMAERAGLVKTNAVWRSYPQAMLFSRCISSGYKVHCPDVFSTAVYVDGELDDGQEQPSRFVASSVVPPVVPAVSDPEPAPVVVEVVDEFTPHYVLQPGDFGATKETIGLSAGEAIAWQGRAVEMAKAAKDRGSPVCGRDRDLVRLAHALRRERHDAEQADRDAVMEEGMRHGLLGRWRDAAKALKERNGFPIRRELDNYSADELRALVAEITQAPGADDAHDRARVNRELAGLPKKANRHDHIEMWGSRGGLDLTVPRERSIANVVDDLLPDELAAVVAGMESWQEEQEIANAQ